MREEFKSSFFIKYIQNGLMIVPPLFALWIVIFRSTVSIGWRIGYAAGIIFIVIYVARWSLRYYKDFSYHVIVTDESIIGELITKEKIEIKWNEISKIEERPAIVTSMFTIYSLEPIKKICVGGYHLQNFDRLAEIIYQKIKEHNIPHIKIIRWL